MLSFFAQEHESQVVCYANANLTRRDQTGEARRLSSFGRASPASIPSGCTLIQGRTLLLSQLNQRGIWFVTIRRRGAAILRRLEALPASQWRQAVIDTPHRRHQRIRYLDETVQLPGYKGSLRQRAVTGLGRSTRPCSCPTTPRRVRGH